MILGHRTTWGLPVGWSKDNDFYGLWQFCGKSLKARQFSVKSRVLLLLLRHAVEEGRGTNNFPVGVIFYDISSLCTRKSLCPVQPVQTSRQTHCRYVSGTSLLLSSQPGYFQSAQ